MKKQAGFTLTELIVVMGIMATLFGFATVRLLGVQQKPQLNTVVSTLVSDLKSQQLRAMTGDGGGTGSALSYGIIFSESQYTLFRGSVFSPTDPGNFTVSLLTPIKLTTGLTDNTIVFNKGNGEIINFSSGGNIISVKNTLSSEQKDIMVNSLGTVVSVQ